MHCGSHLPPPLANAAVADTEDEQGQQERRHHHPDQDGQLVLGHAKQPKDEDTKLECEMVFLGNCLRENDCCCRHFKFVPKRTPMFLHKWLTKCEILTFCSIIRITLRNQEIIACNVLHIEDI